MLLLWGALGVQATVLFAADLAQPSHRRFWRRFLASELVLTTGTILSYVAQHQRLPAPTLANVAESLQIAGAISLVISAAVLTGSRRSQRSDDWHSATEQRPSQA